MNKRRGCKYSSAPSHYCEQEILGRGQFCPGRNPSKSEYILPAQQPEETTERAYRNLEEFVKYLKSFPEVKFITARDAVSIFRDHSKDFELDFESIRNLAWRTTRNIQHQKIDGMYISPAQIFSLMSVAAALYAEN